MTTDYSEFTAMGSDWDAIAADAIGQERIVVNMGPSTRRHTGCCA